MPCVQIGRHWITVCRPCRPNQAINLGKSHRHITGCRRSIDGELTGCGCTVRVSRCHADADDTGRGRYTIKGACRRIEGQPGRQSRSIGQCGRIGQSAPLWIGEVARRSQGVRGRCTEGITERQPHRWGLVNQRCRDNRRVIHRRHVHTNRSGNAVQHPIIGDYSDGSCRGVRCTAAVVVHDPVEDCLIRRDGHATHFGDTENPSVRGVADSQPSSCCSSLRGIVQCKRLDTIAVRPCRERDGQ